MIDLIGKMFIMFIVFEVLMLTNIYEIFEEISWFKTFTKQEKKIIKEQFYNFPDKKYLNLSTFQFDLYEYKECEDYQFLINRLFNKVVNRYENFKYEGITCLKKNKLELFVNGKKHKKSFRVNGSRFDIENLLDFLNDILKKNNIPENFFLLDSGSDIQYPILIAPDILEEAKKRNIVSVL